MKTANIAKYIHHFDSLISDWLILFTTMYNGISSHQEKFIELVTMQQTKPSINKLPLDSSGQRKSKWDFMWFQTARLEEVKQEEYELLETQSIPLRNYLMKHVMPTLTQGLIDCCKVRPDDAVDYLVSFWHWHRININVFLDMRLKVLYMLGLDCLKKYLI